MSRGGLVVSLVAGAVSGRCPVRSRIATFGRLYEGTEDLSPGQTRPLRPSTDAQRLTHATSATPPIPLLSSNLGGMLQNGWHSERKLLASCNAVSA